MAGPYDDDGRQPRDFFLRHDDSAHHHHHASDDEGFNQPDEAERTPFYRYYDEQHGSSGRAHNASEASLPLYRSRSQSLSLSLAMANARHNTVVSDDKEEQQQHEHEETAGGRVAAPPHAQHHATFAQSQPPMPSTRAVDYQQHPSLHSALKSSAGTTNSASATAADTTGWSSNANTLTNSTGNNYHQQEDGQQRHQAAHPHKRIDWAADVAKVFDQAKKTSRTLPDEKAAAASQYTAEKPTLSRASTEQDMDDENAFDDYDWEDDDELVKQLDEKYEEEYKKAHPKEDHRRRTVIRRFSPFHLGKLILTTFLGNLLLILALVAASLIVQFLVKNKTDDNHLQFVCDNIEAWCYWVAFNFIAQWAIHGIFVILPKLFVFVIQLIWGELDEIFIGYVEMFNANAPYIKPLFFAGFFWGSFAIIFNSIFRLRDASDPDHNSRAPYTFRLYQVVELLFFIALVYSLEKILVRIISLNFHAVAYSDRLSNNAFALSTIDKLKSYRPKKRKSYYPKSGANTPSGMHRFGPDGYFSSPYTRSRANTPPFGNHNTTNHNSPALVSSGSPRTPGAPQPSHHSLWSRLPIPNAFRGHPQEPQLQDNAIPMQVTNAHGVSVNESYSTAAATRDRTATQSTANSNHSQQQYGGNGHGNGIASAEASAPGTPYVPQTPAAAEEGSSSRKKQKKGRKAFRLFGRGSATAQQIARQAMVDPLATLNNPDVVGRGLGLDFGSAADAKKLARDLFHAFRGDQSRNYLITKDFYPAFKSEQDAEAAFAVFDKDGNGDISRPEIRATILAAYKERRFLARSLQDVSEAVSTLDRLFQVAAWIIIAMIAFSIFNVNIYSNLTTAYTIALAVSFIFKSAAQNVFDSVIFLFATHPFDSGDRIFLEGETYVVKRLGLFSTLFTKWDGTETMIANSKLGTLTITNLRRSPPQFENATLQFGWNTTLEQIDELEAKMNNWLQKDEKRMFAPSTAAVISSFNYMRWIEVNIGMLHRANWQDWGERWNNRTAFHAAVLHYSKEVGITFVNSAQPVEYWQEDLNKPVEEEQDVDDLDDLRSPLSPAEGSNQIPAPANLQPVMGFIPAEGSTMKRRKGYSKKVGLSGAGT